jgi:hypothetical protein
MIVLKGGPVNSFLKFITICFLAYLAGNAQTDLPLIQKSDITYRGAFSLPNNDLGGSRFGYGGDAICFYNDPGSGKKTLFISGHSWYPGYIAQIEIPPDSTLVKNDNFNDYNEATVLQNFYDVTDGHIDDVGEGTNIYGLLGYHGRLIVGASMYYDAAGEQTLSHGVSGFTLSTIDDFKGFYAMSGVANPRSKGGYMTTIPPEWQTRFGGPALTGKGGLPIISANSCGPCATVFDPDDVGTRDTIPGTTLLFYPLNHPRYPPDVAGSTNPFFNLSTTINGIAFPRGSRSVLFLGKHGTGPYCYGCGCPTGSLGNPTCDDPSCEWCFDPKDGSKGTHAFPYIHQVWAYDANDLLQVKAGTKQTWEISPYAIWRMDEMDTSGYADMAGAGFDPETGRLYITESYGEEPHVHVYQVSVPEQKVVTPAHVMRNNRIYSSCVVFTITGEKVTSFQGNLRQVENGLSGLNRTIPPGLYILTFIGGGAPVTLKKNVIR